MREMDRNHLSISEVLCFLGALWFLWALPQDHFYKVSFVNEVYKAAWGQIKSAGLGYERAWFQPCFWLSVPPQAICVYFLDLRLLVLSTSLCNPDLLGRADTADRGHTLGLDIPFTTLGSYVIHSSEVCGVFSKHIASSSPWQGTWELCLCDPLLTHGCTVCFCGSKEQFLASFDNVLS